MSDFTIESCSTCSARIIWAITVKAKRMPVNAEPEPGGNVALDFRPGMEPLARVLSVTRQFGVKNLRMSHFVTCPQAAQHRRRT